ncbi:MAG: hypothetical protein HFI68_11725 [Lachnospiraceae bacterium]|nr:hypothetical protein [Lachnospiraceae bacterium]
MEYLFLVVCLTAAVTDLKWRRIPNIWLWSWFLTGLLLAGLGELPIRGTEVSHMANFLLHGPENAIPLPSEKMAEYSWQISGALGYLGRSSAALLILHPLWNLRMIGAGDVKFCSIMAGVMGIQGFACSILFSLFFGSVLSLFYMVFTRCFWRRMTYFLAWFRQCISCKRWIPYRKGSDMEGTIPFAPAFLAGYTLWYFF